jgi:hypothetical protein
MSSTAKFKFGTMPVIIIIIIIINTSPIIDYDTTYNPN